MKTNKLSHKGFTGSVEISLDDECLHGRLQHIDDVITYEGQNVSELIGAFKGAVDRYLAYCESTGTTANKPFSGTFNIRVEPELHRACVIRAAEMGLNLNQFVRFSLNEATRRDVTQQVVHNHNITVKIVGREQSAWAGSSTAVPLERLDAVTYTTH